MTGIRKYFIFFLVGLLIWSCSDPEDLVVQSDADFFPLSVGSFFIYDVEETQHSPIGGATEFVYQLKMTVTDSFKNTAGGITYVIQRSKKVDSGLSFEYLDTWSARIEAFEVVVNEGNIPFVRLSFPLVEGKQWDGNALNTLTGEDDCGDGGSFACDIYRIEAKGTPFVLNGDTLTETIEVVQNDNTDIIVKQDVRKEIYARNIGLVYKESTILEYCTVGSCIGQQQIESGFELKQTLVEYGTE